MRYPTILVITQLGLINGPGGVSVFVHENFRTEFIPQLSYANDTIELCTVRVLMPSESLNLISIYRPNQGSIDAFVTELEIVINSSLLNGGRCIITGDFNINLGTDTPSNSLFVECLQSFHYLPVITKPTRFSPNSSVQPSLLDHIWFNGSCIYKAGIVSLDITDHCPTFIQIPIINDNLKANNDKVNVSFRVNNEATRNQFSHLLQNYDWSSIKSNHLNEYTSNFMSMLDELYCRASPLKTNSIYKKIKSLILGLLLISKVLLK